MPVDCYHVINCLCLNASCNPRMLQSLRIPSSTKLIFWYSGWGLTFPSFLSFLRRRAPWGQFRFKKGGGGAWRKWHTGGRSECEPLALCSLPSLRCCQGKKAWLWIPHWDGLAPGGMRANLQPALLPGNSCSLHLPALHDGYLRKVCATPSFQKERLASFVVTDTLYFYLFFYEFTKQPPPPLYAPVLECACITFLLIFTLTPRRR